MSRSIETEFITELDGVKYFPTCLLSFSDGYTTYRYTTLDTSFTVRGDEDFSWTNDDDTQNVEDDDTQWKEGSDFIYSPRGFKFEGVKYSIGNVVDSATIIIDNRDQVMTSIFVDGVIQDNDANISIAVLDEHGKQISIVNIFNGQSDSWTLDEGQIRLTISTDFARWARKTVSYHSSSCRWKEFKGTECQYSGLETWCDRSYSRCVTLVNTDNFGGFRWLPDFENRELFWGPTTEKVE